MTLASTQQTMVTRCPKCSTAFRITAAQLESAKGAVRCGSCLHVFKAQSNLVKKPANETDKPSTSTSAPTQIANKATATAVPVKPAAVKTPASNKPTTQTAQAAAKNTTAKPPTKPAAPVKKPLSKLSDDDDLLISDDMEDGAAGSSRYAFDGYMDLETKAHASSLFDRKMKDEDEDIIKDNSDESWAEELIDEEEDNIPQIGIIKTQFNKPATPPKEEKIAVEKAPKDKIKNNLVFNFVNENKASTNQETKDKYASSYDSHESYESNDNYNSNKDYDDELSEQLRQIAEAHNPTEEKEEIINAIPVAGIFHDDFDSTNKRHLKTEPKIRSYDGSRAGLLKNIIPAPLEFTSNNIGYWYQRALWPVLVIVAVLAIILQLAYFRFDHFSRVQPYRDFYAFACPIVGCTLPNLVDKKQIVTYNLVVQPHSDIENALAVDVMLLNKAEFEQAFPDLLLSFSDMDGKIKASRRFTPDDYLGGELAGKKIMPSKQPIHITLEIKDPQVDNYKMDVL